MRVVLLLAACLLLRAADLAHAGWSDRRDAMDRDAAMSGRSGTVGLFVERDLWGAAFERAARDARNAAYGACGCGSRVGPDGRLGGPV
jgi:hypothetical protein